jgi:phage replication O-like protein O
MKMENRTPQLEDGYTRIANEILEKLATINLSSYQIRVLLFIFRKTYGYGKKEDRIAVSQLVKATGIRKSHISRTKKELLLRKLVTSNGNKIAFQKDSTLWCKLPKQVTIRKVTTSGQKITSLGQKLPLQGNTKETIQQIITKDINKGLSLFKEINPSYEQLFKNKTQRDALKRLINQYGEEWVIKLIKELPEIINKPYAPRITTPYELETKLGQLKVFLQQEKLKATKVGSIKV